MADFAIGFSKFGLAVFFGEPFVAGGACEALLVVGACLSLDAFPNEHLRAFDAPLGIAHNVVAGFAIRLVLEWKVACGESNFAPVTPETPLVPVLSDYVRHLSAEWFVTPATLIIGAPAQIGGFAVPAVHAVGFSVCPFQKLSTRREARLATCTLEAIRMPFFV